MENICDWKNCKKLGQYKAPVKKDNSKNEIIKFEQLNINLENLQPGTITQPKLQETSTFKLIQCMNNSIEEDVGYCRESAKKENPNRVSGLVV